MNPATSERQPSPELIFRAMNAYQLSASLKTAIDLELFTALGAVSRPASELAATTKASERGVRILCDYLVISGLLAKEKDRYRLTPDSAVFLDKHSPAYMGSCMAFMTSPDIRKGFDDLTAAVRNGGTTDGGSTTPDFPAWVEFARSMAPLQAMPAEVLAEHFANSAGAGPVKLLDIAAGHGLFGIAMARKNPRLEVTALDWPAVLEVAKENAAKAGVSARFHMLPGSAFDVPLGDGYNLVLLTNFMHHFDKPTNEILLRKVLAALAPRGLAVTLEFVPNEDRVSPPMSAAFSLQMLAGTPAGDAYTLTEFQQMFRSAGFAHAELLALPSIMQQVIVASGDAAESR